MWQYLQSHMNADRVQPSRTHADIAYWMPDTVATHKRTTSLQQTSSSLSLWHRHWHQMFSSISTSIIPSILSVLISTTTSSVHHQYHHQLLSLHFYRALLQFCPHLCSIDCIGCNIVNPRRACAARIMVLAVSVCVCVCVSVCLSVTTLAAAWPNSTLKLRYD